NNGRRPRKAGRTVPPDVQRDLCCETLEESGSLRVDGRVEAADEDGAVAPLRSRRRVGPSLAQPIEDTFVEGDLEVLGVNAERAEPVDETWEGRGDEVISPQHTRRWRRARDLSDDQTTLGAKGSELLGREKP